VPNHRVNQLMYRGQKSLLRKKLCFRPEFYVTSRISLTFTNPRKKLEWTSFGYTLNTVRIPRKTPIEIPISKRPATMTMNPMLVGIFKKQAR